MKKTVRRVRLADFIFAFITVVVVFMIMVLIVSKSEAADKAYMQKHGKTGVEYVADAESDFTYAHEM